MAICLAGSGEVCRAAVEIRLEGKVIVQSKREQRSLAEWCRDFGALFGGPDSARAPEEMWIATMAHCSSIGEGIRRLNYPVVLNATGHAFCWICSYVERCKALREDDVFYWQNHLGDMVYLKFPNVCGHCRGVPCKCDPMKMDSVSDKGARYAELHGKWKRQSHELQTLRNWLDTFREIYGGRIHLMTLESIGFHLLEEAGEEAQAVRKLAQLAGVAREFPELGKQGVLKKLSTVDGLVDLYVSGEIERDPATGKPAWDQGARSMEAALARLVDAKMDFVIEVADTFSWLCAVVIKLEDLLSKLDLDSNSFDIEEILSEEYGPKGKALVCPTCGNEACSCAFFHS